MNQHISRLDTNTDDSGQQPNHGVGPALRLLLQSFLTSVFDLSDLADNKAQPRHIALQLTCFPSIERLPLTGTGAECREVG
jgi:hypothetical protein